MCDHSDLTLTYQKARSQLEGSLVVGHRLQVRVYRSIVKVKVQGSQVPGNWSGSEVRGQRSEFRGQPSQSSQRSVKSVKSVCQPDDFSRHFWQTPFKIQPFLTFLPLIQGAGVIIAALTQSVITNKSAAVTRTSSKFKVKCHLLLPIIAVLFQNHAKCLGPNNSREHITSRTHLMSWRANFS